MSHKTRYHGKYLCISWLVVSAAAYGCCLQMFHQRTVTIQRNNQTVSAQIYPFGIIADPDELSRDPAKPFTYNSYFLNGQLILYKFFNINARKRKKAKNVAPSFKVELQVFNKPGERRVITTRLNYGNRGGEYSELFTYDGVLYTFDDKTGTVFEVRNADDLHQPLKLIPQFIVADTGNYGTPTDGFFKLEWATIKNGSLYMGGQGYFNYLAKADINTKINQTRAGPWLVDSTKRSIVRLSSKCSTKKIEHLDWNSPYAAIEQALRVSYTDRGYVTHEAVQWSELRKQWVILPRYTSLDRAYSDESAGYQASNMILLADENFSPSKLEVVPFKSPISSTRAVTSFKFVPNTDDRLVIALKAVELHSDEPGKETTQASYVNVIDVNTGRQLLREDVLVDEQYKFEGIEFL